MNDRLTALSGPLYVLLAILILAWGTAGFFDRRDHGTGGYFYGPDYVVASVSEDGGGEEAGIEVGDRMISVGGTPIEDLPMQSRWPQPHTGDAHSIVLDREGERITTEITYRPRTGRQASDFLKTVMVGLAFLGFGLWALASVQTQYGVGVAYICLALAFALFNGPHLGVWDGLASHAEVSVGLLGFILLLRFLLTFPTPKRAGLNPRVTRGLFVVFYLFVGFLVVELIVHPALYTVSGVVTTLLILPVVVLVLLSAAHSTFGSSRDVLLGSGMGWVAMGLAVAFLPPLLQVAVRLAIPGFSLPGSGSFQLLLAAIPAGLALGVRRHARWEGVRTT